MDKPTGMFDRDFEWSALTRFATDPGPGVTLGVVSGRRRQGKTYLLRALCQALGGFYFAAEEAADAESLRRIGAALAEHIRAPAPFVFADWREAVDALLAIGRDEPVPVVIDEFPYLVRAAPSLPSVIQNALAPLRPEREQSRTRLLLCGSAMSFMGRLLAGNAPLRGRAGLELIVRTLDHRLAAQFWGIADPSLAMKVHAIVGGTPAYRREFARDDVPGNPDDFDSWVMRTVLSPASPLFREARYLLADEPALRDTAQYHSVLAAIAHGRTMRGAIAGYLGRKSGDLAHPLTVLEDVGMIVREQDAFRANRTTFHIAEPLIGFYHAVMRPIWSDLEHTREPGELWRRSKPRFSGKVLGPHFAHVCRQWTRHQSPPDLFGVPPSRVAAAIVNDPAARSSHELDVVVFGQAEEQQAPVVAIGEAKWGETMGHDHLARLRHIRGLLAAQGRFGSDDATLICYSGSGFTQDLKAEARQSRDIKLIAIGDLYS
ncbi:MAG: AAA family ATPase [Pseudonocardiaceae bacterium]